MASLSKIRITAFLFTLVLASSAAGENGTGAEAIPPALSKQSLAARAAVQSGIPPRSYYSVILSRKPFGDSADLKPASPPDKQAEMAAAEQARQEQNLARQIDMVAINRSPSGKLLVGLVDKSDGKNHRNFCLSPGDSAGGFTLVEADFNEETATIEREGVSITLKLGKGVVQKDAEGAAQPQEPVAPQATPPALRSASEPSPAPMPNRLTPGAIRRIAPNASLNAGAENRAVRNAGYVKSLRDRRTSQAAATQEEIAKLRQEIKAAEKTSKEEAAKRERAINLELLSRGQDPLSPIELTPEEDADLVRRGVLAPAPGNANQ